MKENSFLPSEEPQEQHQGEGPQGILWQNLLSSISQLFIVRDHREIWWASPILDYLQVL